MYKSVIAFTFFFVIAVCGTLTAQQELALAHAPASTPTDTQTIAAPKPLADRFMPAFTAGFVPQVAYPELAHEYAIEGTVVIEVEVDAAGNVRPIRIVRSLFVACDEAVWEAAKKLPTMLPAVENGRPVAKRLNIPFRFKLR